MRTNQKDTYLGGDSAGGGFDPAWTALLVIDPVNDFLSEGGAGWPMTKHTVQMNDVIHHLRELIDGAHRAGVPVLFGPMAYTREDYTDGQLHRRSGINRVMFEAGMFLAGSWGADFHPDLQPGPDDVVLGPHKGTDVFETDLPAHLDRLGTTHLVIAGMTANLCCESTGRHAVEHGYDVTFLSDAIGAESLPAYEASVHINYPLIANAVMTVDEFLAAVTDRSGGHVQAGDRVLGSDHGEVGTVEEVRPVTGDAPGYAVVRRGVILDRDVHIPLDAVTHRVGGDVFINVPKLVIGKMPWQEPPTAESREARLGPAADQVEPLYGTHNPRPRRHGDIGG